MTAVHASISSCHRLCSFFQDLFERVCTAHLVKPPQSASFAAPSVCPNSAENRHLASQVHLLYWRCISSCIASLAAITPKQVLYGVLLFSNVLYFASMLRNGLHCCITSQCQGHSCCGQQDVTEQYIQLTALVLLHTSYSSGS